MVQDDRMLGRSHGDARRSLEARTNGARREDQEAVRRPQVRAAFNTCLVPKMGAALRIGAAAMMTV